MSMTFSDNHIALQYVDAGLIITRYRDTMIMELTEDEGISLINQIIMGQGAVMAAAAPVSLPLTITFPQTLSDLLDMNEDDNDPE